MTHYDRRSKLNRLLNILFLICFFLKTPIFQAKKYVPARITFIVSQQNKAGGLKLRILGTLRLRFCFALFGDQGTNGGLAALASPPFVAAFQK